MGRNLVLNIADHGHSVNGFDQDMSKVHELKTEPGSGAINASQSLEEFVDILSTPRGFMMLVPAGQVVDSVIHELIPRLESGNLIIEEGNSHFKDTDLRSKSLAEKGILYNDGHLGMTVLAHQKDLRTVVGLGGKLGLPIPCLMASLAYFDGHRSDWLPANLIQAQRDDFGAHTYERVDAKGACN